MIKLKKDLIIIVILIVIFGVGYFVINLSKASEQEQKSFSRSEKLEILDFLSLTTSSTSMTTEEKNS